jgi:hypothetical protein
MMKSVSCIKTKCVAKSANPNPPKLNRRIPPKAFKFHPLTFDVVKNDQGRAKRDSKDLEYEHEQAGDGDLPKTHFTRNSRKIKGEIIENFFDLSIIDIQNSAGVACLSIFNTPQSRLVQKQMKTVASSPLISKSKRLTRPK